MAYNVEPISDRGCMYRAAGRDKIVELNDVQD